MEIVEGIPVIDHEAFIRFGSGDARARQDCKTAAEAMRELCVVMVRDNRIDSRLQADTLDMFTRYFDRPNADKEADERVDLGHQIGISFEYAERARDWSAITSKYPPDQRPYPGRPDRRDVKQRFFHRIGKKPPTTRFGWLNEEPIQPAGFPEWMETCDLWGKRMLSVIGTCLEMMALGLYLPRDFFTRHMKYAPHLVAPTGVDLAERTEYEVIAHEHKDLNLASGHGRATYRLLIVFTRNGKRILVQVPQGAILIQSGMQMSILTGGLIDAGIHQVVALPEAIKAAKAAKLRGRSSWRVTSTVFGHCASDHKAEAQGPFRKKVGRGGGRGRKDYRFGHQVADEIRAIALSKR